MISLRRLLVLLVCIVVPSCESTGSQRFSDAMDLARMLDAQHRGEPLSPQEVDGLNKLRRRYVVLAPWEGVTNADPKRVPADEVKDMVDLRQLIDTEIRLGTALLTGKQRAQYEKLQHRYLGVGAPMSGGGYESPERALAALRAKGGSAFFIIGQRPPLPFPEESLHEDVRAHLRKIETKKHVDCGFEVVKREPYGPNEFSEVGRSSDYARRIEKQAREDGSVHVETWTVECCGSVKRYEVTLMAAFDRNGRRKGTEFTASKLK